MLKVGFLFISSSGDSISEMLFSLEIIYSKKIQLKIGD